MQPIFATSGELNTQPNKSIHAQQSHIATDNLAKTSNKSTQIVHDTKKTRQNMIKDEQVEKKSDKNIAQEKLETKDTARIDKQETAKLEAKKQYDPDTRSKDMTASEVARQETEILDSVKSVKPDGTETYYFPVPVEILTQLPPPGNLGISAKMLEDMMVSDKNDEKVVNDLHQDKVSQDKYNNQKIALQKSQDKAFLNSQNQDIAMESIEQGAMNKVQNGDNMPINYGIA